jgi:hypothetical protein
VYCSDGSEIMGKEHKMISIEIDLLRSGRRLMNLKRLHARNPQRAAGFDSRFPNQASFQAGLEIVEVALQQCQCCRAEWVRQRGVSFLVQTATRVGTGMVLLGLQRTRVRADWGYWRG